MYYRNDPSEHSLSSDCSPLSFVLHFDSNGCVFAKDIHSYRISRVNRHATAHTHFIL